MSLTFDQKANVYKLMTTDDAAAKMAGLTLHTQQRGVNGERVYYTSDPFDNNRPVPNAYAALPFFKQANAKTKERLGPMYADFLASRAADTDFVPSFNCSRTKGYSFMPFQRAGIEYGVKKSNVLIGDEPGLGKTSQSIGICNELGSDQILGIVPASVRLNWHRELREWSANPDINIQIFLNSKAGFMPHINTAIFSYELAKSEGLHNAIMERNWDTLILDEAHYLKTNDAARTQAIFGGGRGHYKLDNYIANKVKNIICLTGTPIPNRPRECYMLAKALCPEAIDWLSYEEFCFRFNPRKEFESGGIKEATGRESELQSRLRSNFMIRRLKKDVLKDLPDKRYEFTHLEPNGDIMNQLQKEAMIEFTLDDLINPFVQEFGMISTIRREMGEAKIPRIVEHCKYLLNIVGKDKIVLFAWHRSVMDALAQELGHFGVVQVRGGMGSIAKDKSVQTFIKNEDTRIFLGQMDSGGVGIDGLQGVCDHVVIAEPAWTPGANEQAVDRLHRIGQHSNVLAQFLIVEGSLDEKVLATVLEKNEVIHSVLDKEH